MRLVILILGWLLGLVGFIALMVPVQWLFGRIDATGSSMIGWIAAAVIFIACAIVLGKYWNRAYGRAK